MAISLQYIYEKSKRSLCNDKPNIWLLIYGFLFNGIVLAFFSNVFYAAVFDRHFIFGIIFWILANYFFIKIKCRKNLNIKRNDENGI